MQLWDEAVSDLDKAIELDPGLVHAYHNKGHFSLLKEDFAGAITYFSKAISLKPNYSLAYVFRAVAYSEIGDKEHCLADLDRKIDSTSMSLTELHRAYLLRSLVYAQLGEQEKADANAAKADELKKQFANPDDAGP
jgi:tetratricopeptide (TPR) repeat protein